jgi:hypothetical protein
MSTNNSFYRYSNELEKIFIGAVIAAVLLSYFTGSYVLFDRISWGLIILLAGFYLFTSSHYAYKIIFSGLALGALGNMFLLGDYINVTLIFVGSAMYTIFGALVIVKAIQYSLKYSGFELLTFLSGLFIFLHPLFVVFAQKEIRFAQLYSFGLAFILLTILYNENLWNRFLPDEKKMITFVIVVAFKYILELSFAYL